MSALPKESYLSPAHYLEIERTAETKSDYLNGIMVAMAGATVRHNLLAVALLTRIARAFENRPCIVFGFDMKVRAEKGNYFRYPDVSALCGPIAFYDEAEDAYSNPQFIAEVLSDSTRAIDRNEKFAEYRLIDTFTEYLMLEPDEMKAELHRKDDRGGWTCGTFTSPEDRIDLESIDVDLSLSDLYAKVEFPSP